MKVTAKPKAEADNIYLVLDYFLIHCFDGKTKNVSSQGTRIDIVIGNHALRAQSTD